MSNLRRRAYSLSLGRNISLRDKHDLDQRFSVTWQPIQHFRTERLRRAYNRQQNQRPGYRHRNLSHRRTTRW